MRYHFTQTKMAIIKETENNKCWPECGEVESLYVADGNVKWCSHFGKQLGSYSKCYRITI